MLAVQGLLPGRSFSSMELRLDICPDVSEAGFRFLERFLRNTHFSVMGLSNQNQVFTNCREMTFFRHLNLPLQVTISPGLKFEVFGEIGFRFPRVPRQAEI